MVILKNRLIDWQPLAEWDPISLSPTLRSWMIFPESFMKRLESHGIHDAAIQVIEQTWSTPEKDEMDELNLQDASQVLIREVLIKSATQHWMYARTILPKETLTDEEAELGQLENRALGSVLFKTQAWKRESFRFAYFPRGGEWFTKINQHIALPVEGIWARRSQFSLKEKKLLLTEFFLPDIESLI